MTLRRLDLNIPIALISSLSVVLFLDLPTPPGNYWNKLGRMDWMWVRLITADSTGLTKNSAGRGNLLVIGSTVAYTIGLTWGGTTAPWGSATVLVPLVLGLVGLMVFIAYEATFATHPLVCNFPIGLFWAQYSLCHPWY